MAAKQNQDAFNLYKSQRDADDSIRKELSDLKAQVAINAAVRPYQDKLIQCEIDKAFTAGINYIASILLIQVKAIYLPCCRYAKLYLPLHCFKNKKVEEYGRRT